jgi:hypothetical protein
MSSTFFSFVSVLLLALLLVSVFLTMSTASKIFKSMYGRPLGVGILSNAIYFGGKGVRCENLTINAKSGDLANNPLCKKDGLPLFNEIKANHVGPAIQYDINKMKNDFAGKLQLRCRSEAV